MVRSPTFIFATYDVAVSSIAYICNHNSIIVTHLLQRRSQVQQFREKLLNKKDKVLTFK